MAKRLCEKERMQKDHMMVGTIQNLTITRLSQYGAFLQTQSKSTEILLPRKFVDLSARVGESVRVFIMHDSEDRIVATTQIPHLLIGEIGALEVVDSNAYGYFADLGVDKHLFIPHKAPKRSMIGKNLVVYLTLDKQGRLIGKLGIKERLCACRDRRLLGHEVCALVFERTPLGFGCVVEALDLKRADEGALEIHKIEGRAHYGLLYASEVACVPKIGEKIAVRIKTIRVDGKIDLRVLIQSESSLLEVLERHNGRVELDFKSSPQEIASVLQMSKKNFKTLANKLVREGKAQFVDSKVRDGHKALVLV